jgi:putative methionine-R-sulfoxide reductase with GAF domain
LRESTQKIAILYDISQAILSSVDLDEILLQVLVILRDHFQLQSGTVFLFDPVKNELYVRAHLGKRGSKIGQRSPLDEGMSGAAARLKRPVYAPDLGQEPHFKVAVGSGSEVAIPLLVRDELVGVLDLHSDKLNYFDGEMIDMLTLLGAQASMAVENSRVRALQKRRGEQLEAINTVARHTTAVLDLDELLRVVCNLLLEWFRADHVAVLLVEGDVIRLRAHEGRLTPKFPPGAIMEGGAGMVARALAAGKSVVENDVTATKKALSMKTICSLWNRSRIFALRPFTTPTTLTG